MSSDSAKVKSDRRDDECPWTKQISGQSCFIESFFAEKVISLVPVRGVCLSFLVKGHEPQFGRIVSNEFMSRAKRIQSNLCVIALHMQSQQTIM